MPRSIALFCLLLTTAIWGFAFIAQKTAMDVMGPLTFMASRYLLGGLVILPLALRENGLSAAPLTGRDWTLIGVMSVVFFIASLLQQLGLIFTTVTNSGFLTGLYVLLVPLILLVFFRTAPHRIVWFAAPFALFGLFLLNGATLSAINRGDALVIASAVFWALHVLLIGLLATRTRRPVLISAISFLIAGGLSAIGALAFEAPTIEAISSGWIEILYAGLMSTAIAYTLQAVGQQHVPPANAAIILSAESLFAALGGALLLGERLPPEGYAGAALIFAAIILVEAVPQLRRRSPTAPG